MSAPAGQPPLHRLPVRVYFEDTDAGGVVYHGSFLRFAERARTELLRALGYDHRTLRERHGVLILVRRCVLDCLLPGRLDDLLEVRSHLDRMGGASLVFTQEVVREDELVARMEVRVGFVDLRGRATRMPNDLKAAFVRWAA